MSDDGQLKRAVLDELEWEPRVNAAHIGVQANDGVVTLTGHVASFTERHAAEKAASRVRHVRAIAEAIEVRLPFDQERGDEEIARAATERLAWEGMVPRDAIKVKVESGVLTLSGEVAGNHQRQASEKSVRGLTGVLGVINQITLQPPVDAAHVGDAIQKALTRTSFYEPHLIEVRSEGGHVWLSGTVQSWRNRQEALAVAWSARGTTSVENRICVL